MRPRQIVNNSVIVMAVSEGRQRIRLSVNAGKSIPAHAAVGAKEILAFSDPYESQKIINRVEVFEQFTHKTITSK